MLNVVPRLIYVDQTVPDFSLREYLSSNTHVIKNTIIPEIKKYYKKESSNLKTLKEKSETVYGNLITKRPMWSNEMRPDDFQKAVYKYLQEIPEMFKLQEINNIQDQVDFIISYPDRSKPGQIKEEKFKYGHGDLLRFLTMMGESDPETTILKIDGNPFYVPIKYELPDVTFNEYFEKIKAETSIDRLLYDISILLEKYDGLSETDINDRVAIVMKSLKIMKHILNMKYDPTFLSKFIDGQERPMYKYLSENLKYTTENFDKKIVELSKKGTLALYANNGQKKLSKEDIEKARELITEFDNKNNKSEY